MGFISIARKTIGILFDVLFIQQFVWRLQPISQEVFHKGYGEAIPAASETRLVEKGGCRLTVPEDIPASVFVGDSRNPKIDAGM